MASDRQAFLPDSSDDDEIDFGRPEGEIVLDYDEAEESTDAEPTKPSSSYQLPDFARPPARPAPLVSPPLPPSFMPHPSNSLPLAPAPTASLSRTSIEPFSKPAAALPSSSSSPSVMSSHSSSSSSSSTAAAATRPRALSASASSFSSSFGARAVTPLVAALSRLPPAQLLLALDRLILDGLADTVYALCEYCLEGPASVLLSVPIKVQLEFWRAAVLGMRREYDKAIEGLEKLLLPLPGSAQATAPSLDTASRLPHLQPMQLAVLTALLLAHASRKTKDRKTLGRLRSRLQAATKQSTGRAFVFAAHYFELSGNISKAKQCLQKALLTDRKNPAALAAFGWLHLKIGTPRARHKARQAFRSALRNVVKSRSRLESSSLDVPGGVVAALRQELDTAELAAELGLCRHQQMERELSTAMQLADTVLAKHTDLLPALEEKARIFALSGQWQSPLCRNTLAAIQQQAPDSLLLHRLALLAALLDRRLEDANKEMQAVLKALESEEPSNDPLLLQISLACARFAQADCSLSSQPCAACDDMLKRASEAVKRIVKNNRRSVSAVCTLAQIRRMNGND